MSSLLSPEDHAEIRAALMLVTDTFMVTPVLYKKHVAVLDRFEEDREAQYLTYNLLGLVEPVKRDIEEALSGSKDFEECMISFNLEDIQVAGLINSVFALDCDPETDYFITRGQTYRLTDAYTEGPLSAKDCLVIIKGKLSEKVF